MHVQIGKRNSLHLAVCHLKEDDLCVMFYCVGPSYHSCNFSKCTSWLSAMNVMKYFQGHSPWICQGCTPLCYQCHSLSGFVDVNPDCWYMNIPDSTLKFLRISDMHQSACSARKLCTTTTAAPPTCFVYMVSTWPRSAAGHHDNMW